MSSQTPALKPYFDYLPDHVLQSILVYIMDRSKLFYIDQVSCRMRRILEHKTSFDLYHSNDSDDPYNPIGPSPENTEVILKKNLKDENPMDENPEDPRHHLHRLGKKFDEKSKDSYSMEPLVYGSQRVHVADWVLIHSISRRVRKLGKEAFFKGKTFAMDLALPGKIQDGKVPFLSDIENRKIALDNIIDVVFVNIRLSTPVDFVTLPKRVRLFLALKFCTLVAKVDDGNDMQAGVGTPEEKFKLPEVLWKLLIDNGIPESVELRMICPDPKDWEERSDRLKNVACLFLDSWAGVLRAAEGKRTSQHMGKMLRQLPLRSS
ncbi:hypothetical protein HD806DRAFT_491956 [Xylariaceae sp. AK1471]|nr:hypothetical protein HD806DRAFT_491956 [Xylariaceae sp. AK1471]